MYRKIEELIDVKDVFETKRLVLIKSEFMVSNQNITKFALGFKDKQGDIIQIVTLLKHHKKS